MATYWDYERYTTNWDATSTYGSSSSDDGWVTGTTTASGWTYYVREVIKKYLVSNPEHWNEADQAAFVALVNDKTNTGFIVEMLIDGDIKITDPNVEKRTMEDFIPLLKRKASAKDKEIIDKFFETHSIKKPKT